MNGDAAAGGGPDDPLLVLVCDDRPDVRRELSRALQYGSQGPVECVSSGSELLAACRAGSPSQVMIGVHPGSTFGADMLDLLLTHHPKARPVVYGSRRDIECLAAVYARGAGGLLLWDIGIRGTPAPKAFPGVRRFGAAWR